MLFTVSFLAPYPRFQGERNHHPGGPLTQTAAEAVSLSYRSMGAVDVRIEPAR